MFQARKKRKSEHWVTPHPTPPPPSERFHGGTRHTNPSLGLAELSPPPTSKMEMKAGGGGGADDAREGMLAAAEACERKIMFSHLIFHTLQAALS